MHHQLHALGVGIVVEALEVEVGIGRHEVEHIVLGMAKPVFPTDVPALHEHLVEPVLGRKVNVAAHIGRVSRMPAVRPAPAVVGLPEVHGGQVVGVAPCPPAGDHLPPHAAILDGLDP